MTSPLRFGLVLGWVSMLLAASVHAEELTIPTLTLATETFIRGGREGKKQVISGELDWPTGASGPVPAVVVMHGGSGVQP